jgi:hypothetical protein
MSLEHRPRPDLGAGYAGPIVKVIHSPVRFSLQPRDSQGLLSSRAFCLATRNALRKFLRVLDQYGGCLCPRESWRHGMI